LRQTHLKIEIMQKYQLNFFSLVVIFLILQSGCTKPASSPATKNGNTNAKQVLLKIESDLAKPAKEFSVPWKDGQTVLDVMNAAKEQGLKFEIKGEAEKTFISNIDDISNPAGEENPKFWLYYVNGKKANRSAGGYSINPGDVILWKFEQHQ
jgi:hypothetical protein